MPQGSALTIAFGAFLVGALLLSSGLRNRSLADVLGGRTGLVAEEAKAVEAAGSSAPATAGRAVPGGLAGLLPKGAPVLKIERTDQGRDVQLKPGQQLLATGNYEVLAIKSNPEGFGPDYPILKMLTGPYAGHDVYYGHTDAAPGLHAGMKGSAGDVVAVTSRTGHNAPPGHLEFGFAPGGTPGPWGQPTPF